MRTTGEHLLRELAQQVLGAVYERCQSDGEDQRRSLVTVRRRLGWSRRRGGPLRSDALTHRPRAGRDLAWAPVMRAFEATTNPTATRERVLVATPERDGYEVLGVPRDADAARIRAAFRKLAAKYHPDRNPDPSAGDQFTKITEAYAALSDPGTREELEDPSVSEARRAGRSPGVAWLSPEDLWAGVDTTGLVEDRGGGMLHERRGSGRRESVAVERLSSRGRPSPYSRGPHRP